VATIYPEDGKNRLSKQAIKYKKLWHKNIERIEKSHYQNKHYKETKISYNIYRRWTQKPNKASTKI